MSFHESNKEHASAIKTPRQLLITVVLAFVIPIAVIILLVNFVGSSIRTGAGSDSQTPEAIAKRLQPVAGFELVGPDGKKISIAGTTPVAAPSVASSAPAAAAGGAPAAGGAAVVKTGEEVYKSTCFACHGTGAAGAPKFEDKASWAPFIKQGFDSLLKNALHGIGAMPPRGGNASLTDLEVARAVVYMTNHSGADFPEPKAPEAAGGAAAPAAAAPAATGAAPAASGAPTTSGNGAAASGAAASGNGAAPAANGTAAAAPASAAGAVVASAAGSAAPSTNGAAAAKPAAAAAGDNAVGKKLYESVCITCHASGVAGAPKFGDKATWEPFLKTGLDEMLKKAISGVGAMPPRGGSQATDAELKAAIEYMTAAAKS